jgi:hypothetical protein
MPMVIKSFTKASNDRETKEHSSLMIDEGIRDAKSPCYSESFNIILHVKSENIDTVDQGCWQLFPMFVMSTSFNAQENAKGQHNYAAEVENQQKFTSNTVVKFGSVSSLKKAHGMVSRLSLPKIVKTSCLIPCLKSAINSKPGLGCIPWV